MARKIEIDQETRTKVERAHYEYNALLNVEKAYIDDHMLDPDGSAIDNPIFNSYHEKTIAALKAYEDEKSEMMKRYELESVTWQLDFSTGEITISD